MWKNWKVLSVTFQPLLTAGGSSEVTVVIFAERAETRVEHDCKSWADLHSCYLCSSKYCAYRRTQRRPQKNKTRKCLEQEASLQFNPQTRQECCYVQYALICDLFAHASFQAYITTVSNDLTEFDFAASNPQASTSSSSS